MRRKITQILAVLVMLVGFILFLYPIAAKYLAGYKSSNIIKQFQKEIKKQTEEKEFKDNGETGLNGLYSKLQTYNEQLYKSGQSGISNSLDYESVPFDLTQYGFSQNVISTLWIPRMNVELPVYLGANSDSLAKGAGLVGGTSMPVEGENTNVVLAGHRGYRGIPMFRDIQLLQIGDKLSLTTPWETRIYRVKELKIIEPEDTNEVLIEPGEERLTLLTCHPYTKNYQRYMVVAEYAKGEKAVSYEEDLAESKAAYNEQPKQVTLLKDGEETEVLVESKSLIPVFYEENGEWGAGYSNIQIAMENYGVWILFFMVCIIVVIVIRRSRSDKDKKSV